MTVIPGLDFHVYVAIRYPHTPSQLDIGAVKSSFRDSDFNALCLPDFASKLLSIVFKDAEKLISCQRFSGI